MLALAVALLLIQDQDPSAQGAKALDEGRYEAAAAAFTRALAADPADYFAHFNLAMAYTQLRRDPEAAAEYRKTLQLKPGLYEAEINLGILLMRGRQPAEALPHLSAAAAARPAEFRARFFLAQAQLDTADLPAAEAGFAAASAMDAKSPEAQLGWARALARQGKLAEASPHYSAAAQLDPEFKDGLLELAGLYEKAGAAAEAMAVYRGFPASAVAQERLGALLLASKQYGDAAARLEQAYAKDPTAANRAALAQAYLLNSQPERAAPLLERAVADAPGNYELRMAYGRLLRDARQFPPAAVQFQAAAQARPAETMAWTELATVQQLAGEFPAALAALDQALATGAATPGVWFVRAVILERLKQPKPALEAYRKFLTLSQNQLPDQEFQARQRARILERDLEKR